MSPLIFNLFINDLPDQFDDQCDPVHLGGQAVHALMFADDVVILSQSADGLRRSIDITVNYFNSIYLDVNFDKSQIMIFNPRGSLLNNHSDHIFQANGHKLKVVKEYTYLGFKFTPSGCASHGAEELFNKSRRSWFSISNMIYKYKRLKTDKAFQIFDQLVTSIGLFNCEYWLPLIISKKCFSNEEGLFSFWETFKLETINQKISRMVLSVHKKSSRLAVLGELGRFPLLIKGICHALKYRASLLKIGTNCLISKAVVEMQSTPDLNCTSWWAKIGKIETLLDIKYSKYSNIDKIGDLIKQKVKSKFELFWLNQINKISLKNDGIDHNKLRFYKTFKGCFKKEAYIDLVPNRNQRSDLIRLRISASRLAIETKRYSRPYVPESQRFCTYCTPSSGQDNLLPGYVDNEEHFLLSCETFQLKRNCFLAKLGSVLPHFQSLSKTQQLSTILCPRDIITAKLSNKYIKILFNARKQLDDGEPVHHQGYESGVVQNEFFDELI